jgi:hypothetical protein
LRYQDIWFGHSYKVKRTFHRAEVVGSVKKGVNGRYRIPVRYPDAKPGSKLADAVKYVETTDFVHSWTNDDQEAYSKYMQETAEVQAVTSGLVAAGYPPYAYRKPSSMQLYLSFDNETAEEVIKVLLAHPQESSTERKELSSGE